MRANAAASKARALAPGGTEEDKILASRWEILAAHYDGASARAEKLNL